MPSRRRWRRSRLCSPTRDPPTPRVPVDLREAHGDNADLVAMLIANPELITARPKPRDDPARAEAKRAERREKRAAAAAARASRDGAGRRARARRFQKETQIRRRRGRKRRRRLARRRHAEGHEHARGRLCVRFWNLWGVLGVSQGGHGERARLGISRPARGVEGDAAGQVHALRVDAPMLLHRAPRLLELETVALVRAIVRMKHILPGGDIGRILELAPESPARRRRGVRRRGGGRRRRARRERNGALRAATFYQAAAKLVRDGGAASRSRAGRRRRPWSCR